MCVGNATHNAVTLWRRWGSFPPPSPIPPDSPRGGPCGGEWVKTFRKLLLS